MDLYAEKYKTLVRGNLKDRNKSSSILCSWIGRLKRVKMSVLLKCAYRVNTILIKTSAGCL